uniref:U9-lycotoxin-Ls1a n=1 Tax=Lycosa singoriensis TaxID=434756 RepID=TX830_LYCSI|nr:RecName: Full=U9-lycotoxin-Ls1a; AltName: Full=Toxin-like structure LSTX-H30; Flags: Precursor [Lycosa singoriensis]
MKLLLFTALVLVVIVSLIEAEAENERACLAEYKVCTDDTGNCCSNLVCDCYRRSKHGVPKGRSCFCLEKDVRYTREI